MVNAWAVAADILDPGGERYRPRGGCAQLYWSTGDEILIAGPAGTGKSRACLERLHMLALQYPRARALMLRKTQTSLASSAMVTYEEHVAAEALASGVVEWKAPTQRHPGQYLYSNGSVIVVGGLDKASKIMSTEYDTAYVQEAIELVENDWEAVTTRLRNGRLPFQQLLADTNPSMPTHWLKQRCDNGRTQLIESRHEDNPVLFDDDGHMTPAGRDYIGKLDRLTGPRFNRLRRGIWTSAEGTIYEGWDPAIHLIDRFPIPAEWRRWWVVDFGFRNPFCLQWWAEDGDGRLFMYREIYMTGRLVEDHARQALSLVTDKDGTWLEPKPRGVICDHDAEDRATFERHARLGTLKADKRVKVGIEAVAARLRPDATGRPALFVLRDSLVERDPALDDAKKPVSTADEFPGYIWAPTADGKPSKEEPLKVDDHGMDNVRYLVAHRDLQPRARVRWM